MKVMKLSKKLLVLVLVFASAFVAKHSMIKSKKELARDILMNEVESLAAGDELPKKGDCLKYEHFNERNFGSQYFVVCAKDDGYIHPCTPPKRGTTVYIFESVCIVQ